MAIAYNPHPIFQMYNQAACSFQIFLEKERESQKKSLSQLANDTEFLEKLCQREDETQLNKAYLKELGSLQGFTPSTYLTDVRTLVGITQPEPPERATVFPAVVISPGHKSSLEAETISHFFASCFPSDSYRVFTTFKHPTDLFWTPDPQATFITGLRRPLYNFTIAPSSVKELPKSFRNYLSSALPLFQTVEFLNRRNFFYEHEKRLIESHRINKAETVNWRFIR